MVNLSKAAGANGFTVTDTLGGTTLTGSNHGDTFNGGLNDTINAGNGTNIINGVSGDKITGGTGVDTFNITAGKETISNLGSGADILTVTNGATVNATINTTGWTATAATVNNGSATLTTAGHNVDLHLVTSGNGFSIIDTGSKTTITGTATGNDSITAGANDIIKLGEGADSIKAAAGDTFVINGFSNAGHASINTVDSISSYVKTDAIQYHSAALTIGNAASGNAVSFDNNGNATFGTAPASLATAVNEIAAAFDTGSHAVGGAAVNGEFAFFKFGTGTSAAEYLYISSGTNGVNVHDTLIQLVGVTTPASGVTLTTVGGDGHLTFTP